MSGERHIELVWRCNACQHQNLGRHMICQNCGDPKDESEEYEMPSDTAASASVEDAKLLEMAQAGEHWKCAYCGSHQRDLDGACARCGAGRAKGANPGVRRGMPNSVEHEQDAFAAAEAEARANSLWRKDWFRVAVMIGAMFALVLGIKIVRHRARAKAIPVEDPTFVVAPPIRTDFPATVKTAAWTRTVTLERRQLVDHEGFTDDVPSDAVKVKAAGTHFHHNEQVYDHDETVYDDVEVPDGTRTETYSEREACGQDCTGGSGRTCRQVCTDKPQSCHEVCKNKKNGFASCHQECTGGGQSCHDECTGSDRSCSTRYCDRTKTREIPKTKRVKQPRIVKKYRDEPRFAAWSTYQAWEWFPVSTAGDTGLLADMHWPDAGAPKPPDFREQKKESFVVTFAYEDGAERTYAPTSIEEFQTYAPGRVVQTRVVGGQVSIVRDL